MKHPFLATLMLLVLTMCTFSCSSDEEESPGNDLIGVWTGGLLQPNFGTLSTSLNITSINDGTGQGSGSFSTTDLSACDNAQFVCETLACDFTLSLLSTSGSKYEFDQMLIGTSTCGDGIFELTLVDANTINAVWYQEAFPENIATGQLTK